ncbi:hypothetical protein JKA74_13190 [Marivirga sp. S37H4]|uniref:histidine kinase n=1 Tax=Marivirga aurantiaca TaxID=2802615 RepID=A0A935C964_9BACT|nr:ATP-binding protein [Marivirga aurantiaca]MBK6265991.1 hypothetical protein [Marivirga aurantiaca]
MNLSKKPYLFYISSVFLSVAITFPSQSQLIHSTEQSDSVILRNSTLLWNDFFNFTSFQNEEDENLADSSSQVKKHVTDSIIIRNFDGSLYRASSYNYKSVEDEDGILYFGNENGLLEFDGADWILHQTHNFTPVTNLIIVEDKIYTVGNDEIGFFQRDKLGAMQYHSLREKIDAEKDIKEIYFIHELNGKIYFTSYKQVLAWDGELFKEIKVLDAHSFKVGGELILSVYDKGLAVPDGDTVRYVNTDFSFKNDAAFNIIKNRYGEWIIFTSESGFFKLDTSNYTVTPWENEINSYFLQKDRYLLSAVRLRDSLFMASTYNNGVLIFNDSGKILYEFNDKNGLNVNYYNMPMADRRGNVWLSNGLGVNYLKWYDKDEQFNFIPTTVVRHIVVDDSTVFIKNQQQRINLSGELVKAISFNYATPSFTTNDLEYSYYLEGFDEGWSQWNTATKKEYTNLSGGKYTFQVKARHIYLENMQIKPFVLSIYLPTPWYLNKWYYFLAAVLITGAIFTFIRLRTQRLNVANKKLEYMVRERTSELVSQKEQLKIANEELKIINNELDNFVYRSSHDLVAPLKSLRGLIQIAQNENDRENQLQYFHLMNTSINKLEDFIKSIMDFSTNSKKPIELTNIKLDELLDSIVHDLKYYENSDKVKLIRHYDSEFGIKTDIKRLHIVLSNLITNAVKYHNYSQHDEPYIKISASLKEDFYELVVEDNGQGIPQEYHPKIFDMFFRAHQGKEGSGLGLYIVVDTLNVLQGKISFTSTTRKGTSFKITLPVPAD